METEKVTEFIEILKAVLLSLMSAIALVAVFALVKQLASLPDKIILPVNLTIKAVAIFIGCAGSLRGSRGWIRGIIVGLVFTCLSGLLFGLVGGDFAFTWLLIVEVVFGAVTGGLSGAFAVNLR